MLSQQLLLKMLFHNARAILSLFAEADGRISSLIESQISRGRLFKNWIFAPIAQIRRGKRDVTTCQQKIL
jgi:hypothetical protein